jgi:putative ATP-binding cassette transporter
MNISKGYWGKYTWFAILSILSALGSMGVLYTINNMITDYVRGAAVHSGKYLLYFCGSVVCFVFCRWVVSKAIIKFTQELLMKTRQDVLKMLLRMPYLSMERNQNKVITALTSDTGNIVNAAVNVIDLLTNIVIIAVCYVYMAMISWKLLLCLTVVLLGTLGVYLLSEKGARKLFRRGLEQNDRFFRYLNEIIGGFKEICIAPERGTDIVSRRADVTIREACILNEKAQVKYLGKRIIGVVSFYCFIALTMLWLGGVFGLNHATLVSFVLVVLCTWGPLETLVLLIPNFSQAKTSFKRILELEELINFNNPVVHSEFEIGDFELLEMEGIVFSYKTEDVPGGDAGFSVGPLDFRMSRGEAIFISGGNGSGKTTFVNILSGLIDRDGGSICVNDIPIAAKGLTSYRSLYAPVYSDFFLFSEFYGMPGINVEKAREYLHLFGIDNKVTVSKAGFSTIDLSTGQRKRLAVIHALLERKPILILDEFAADQDPHFKRKFYYEIVPYIKSEGFTLIAITHDDNYYHCADRLFRMDSGRMAEVKQSTLTV